MELAGKRALVTGAGQRVGRAIALELGAAGMRVAVHYRSSREGAERTCEEIRSAGGAASSIQADLSDRAQARRLVDEAVQRLGGLDLLVPSAASFERVPYAELDDAAWDRSLELDLSAPFALAHQASPALRAARGAIVFVTCSSTTTPFRNYLPYVVAKGALKQLMRTLALELAPDVRVNAVAPGTVLPPDDMPPEAVERLAVKAPLGRIGSAEDIADAVVYLALADFVTGQELVVDGGRSVAGLERYE
jgi:pteridine reductase